MPLPLVASFALQALPTLIGKLPELASIFKDRSKDSQDQYAEAAMKAVDIIKTATQTDSVEGAIKALDEPDRLMAARHAVRLSFPELMQAAQFDEDSRGKARDFTDRMTGTGPAWRQIGFGAILGILALVIVVGGGWTMRDVIFDISTTAETKGNVIGAFIAVITLVAGFFFGSSVSSRQKDDTIQQASRRDL